MGDIEAQAREAAIRQLIAVRAYEMWENQGRPHGCDLIHWRQAEQDVTGCLASASAVPDVAPPAPAKQAARKPVAA